MNRDGELTLFIDADDTLWENNIYFEQAVDAFVKYLDHSSMTREQIKATIDEFEHVNVISLGYGTRSFATSLRHCYEHLAERDISDTDLATIIGFADLILHQEMQLLEGVEQTLHELSRRHRLVMVTKGYEDEQRMKIDRSGIGHFFLETIVVPEKVQETYEGLMLSLETNPDKTWMVGNSPKSDINPARQAGLGAVFIPHSHTWSLEVQEIDSGDSRLIVLERFAELLNHF